MLPVNSRKYPPFPVKNGDRVWTMGRTDFLGGDEMGAKWRTTKYPGVRFREHATRRHGVVKDRYFSIRYQRDGRRQEKALGWASEGWTAEKAARRGLLS